ncbi:NAD(P)-dependent alcohol dehydrogenase [Cellulomonas sp.]|uniref:NAD(P)-dependent alcohol dehydrogenase n=1 Tax=Cellulomonas sp. TaxID=40001 RepID=UPI00281139BE|nr:NAD(P)-dependent alcohol dehydrogenase [Cellulomonas sp.]
MPAPSPSTDTPTPATTTVVAHHRYGPPEVLVAERAPMPVAGADEVVLAVEAVAVSRAEAAFRAARPAVARLATGLLRPRRPVLGGDVGGRVLAVGAGVTHLRPGDRVLAQTGIAMGGYARHLRAPATAVLPVPDGVPTPEAVALAEGGSTALPFVRDHARVRPGTRLLVNGASGAVGAAAVQLAAHLGAEVTGVCSTDHVELVRSLGAASVVDRTRTPLEALAGPYDVVLDAVGTSSFRRCRHLLAPGGSYLTTVPGAGILVRTALRPVLRGPLLRGPLGGRTAAIAFTGLRPAADRLADVRHLLDLAAAGAVRGVVDRTWPLEEAAAAHAYVDTGRKAGTVLLLP